MALNQNSTKSYSAEEHRLWTKLYCRQVELVQGVACNLYVQGFNRLSLDPFQVPDQRQVSKDLSQMTGWTLANAQNNYLNADEWFDHLVHYRFPATDYIRSENELDYTPYPDLFHEYFGHLPFMTNSYYADIVHRYGEVYCAARTDWQRLVISRLWWFSMEFGLIWEDGREKIVGASLYSSNGEHRYAVSNAVPHHPFDIHQVAETASSTHAYHSQYFVVDSIEHLRAIVDDYGYKERLEI